MKNTNFIGYLIQCGFFFIFVIAVLIVGWLIRKSTLKSFHQNCRALGLYPSSRNSYYCLGNWKDAGVAVKLCRIDKHQETDLFMELGDLPEEVVGKLDYYMQGLKPNYLQISGFGKNKNFDQFVPDAWRGLYFQTRLKFSATDLNLRQMFEIMYGIRTELQRRVYGK